MELTKLVLFVVIFINNVSAVYTKSTVKVKRLLTYNTFLAPRFENYLTRKPKIIEMLKKSNDDVICLQETYVGQDISELKAAIRKRYPYSYSGIHQNDAMKSGPPCSPTDLLTVLCIQSQGCLNLPTELEQLQCAILNCSSFDKLSQECSTCVAVAGTSFSDVQAICITSPYAFNSDGLVLFSKQPMLEIKRTEFHPGFVQLKLTSYIQAKIKGLGHVICTHLRGLASAVYSETNLPFSSYYQQTKQEVALLLNNTSNLGKLIIMGDLNVGPIIPEKFVSGIYEDLYKEFTSRGFKSPYADKDGRCTFCTENALASQPWPYSVLIDHIMTKGYKTKTAKRVFDGFPRLSDHYGVEITICLKRN